MYIKRVVVFVCFVIYALCVKSQPDSLLSTWNNTENSAENRIAALHEYYKKFFNANYDSANYYIEMALQFAKANELKKYEAKTYIRRSNMARVLGRSEEAEANLKRSLKIGKEIKDSSLLVSAYNHLGILNYKTLKNYYESYLYLSNALDILSVTKDSIYLAQVYNNMGVLYMEVDMLKEAIKIFEKTREVFKIKGDFISELAVKGNLSKLYSQSNQNDKALELGLEVKDSIHLFPRFYRGLMFSILAKVYYDNDRKDSCMKYSRAAVDILTKSKDIYYISALEYLGLSYLPEQPDSALLFGFKALELKDSVRSFSEESVYDLIYKAYKQKGNTEMALEYREKMTSKSEVKKVEARNEIMIKKIKNHLNEQIEEKQKKNSEEKEAMEWRELKNAICIIIGALVLIAILLFYFSYKGRQEALEKEALLKEIETLKSKVAYNSVSLPSQGHFNKQKVDHYTSHKLNESDWAILECMYQNPSITIPKIGESVHMSVGGVKSSLKKMYRIFEINDVTNKKYYLTKAVLELSSK